jgi:hypothetical protein
MRLTEAVCRTFHRLLAESGRHSISPIFNVGLFLPSGLKLAEGSGSSLKMAEHRACVNALTSIYLVRKEFTGDEEARVGLPTSVHEERAFRGLVDVGKGDGVFGTGEGKRKWRGGKA